MKFKVANINCQNCVNLIKNSLEADFGKIEVNLAINPKILSIDLSLDKEECFKKELSKLGFEILERVQ